MCGRAEAAAGSSVPRLGAASLRKASQGVPRRSSGSSDSGDVRRFDFRDAKHTSCRPHACHTRDRLFLWKVVAGSEEV